MNHILSLPILQPQFDLVDSICIFLPVNHADLNVLISQACGLYCIHQYVDAITFSVAAAQSFYCVVPLQIDSCDCI